jgi:uncharacterized protein YjdB
MDTFSTQVGKSERIQANPVDDLHVPQPITGNVSYTSSNEAVATVTPNAGAAGQIQVDVKGVAAGSAIITATAQDAESPAKQFSGAFTINVTAPATPHASTFDFADIGPV